MTRIDKIFRTILLVVGTVGFIMAVYNKMNWSYSIHNKDNDPYIVECAFNLGINPHEVTQKQFNNRYK